jgi:drug/metabolite transporter (DMT)-like permease
MLFAVHILVIDYFSPKTNGVAMSCIQFYVSGAISLVGMLLTEHPTMEGMKGAALAVLYAGVLSCGAGYTLQIIGQRGMNPTIASLIMSLESVISVLAGWVILGQTLSRKELLGCIIVFVAVILVQLPEKSSADSGVGK